ncbi:MAG TPA: C39 family peptidase [Anaerolineae bacterium]|nr:C39 family peptidase [Anaerolineae bacterium]
MSKRAKYTIPLILLALVLFVGGFIAVPRVVGALPGEYRVRLARIPLVEPILEIGTTPLPTALPAPSIVATLPRITIPAVLPATATPTAEPTSTPELAEEVVDTQEVTPTATSTATPSPTATPTPVPLPRQARIEGLEIVAQGFNNCGPANLTMNLNFYGNDTTQNEAAAFLKPNREDRNVSPWQLSDYVNEHTSLRSTAHSGGDLELIKRFVAAGFPIVIEKGYEPTPKDGWLGHYLTVFGYDENKQELYGMDTYLGPWDNSGRADSYETVEYYWQQFNYTFFVVYPPEKERLVFDLLGPDLLDEATMWQNAAQRAQAAIDSDPENAFAWFNLGTSLTRLGEMTGESEYYENGAAAFDQARILGIPPRIVWYQFRPYTAYMRVGRYQDMIDLADVTLTTQGGRNVEETYLFKGHALALQGDAQGAIEAYEQAIRLNEFFYPARWALDSITGS